MPIDTFQWRTQAAPVGNFSHNVRSAQFGDGYKQISSNGLNSVTQSWQLVYTGHPTVTESLLSFLNAHVIRAFFWTPPGGRKICLESNLTPSRYHRFHAMCFR